MTLLRAMWTIFLIDHIIVDPVTGKHYFVLEAHLMFRSFDAAFPPLTPAPGCAAVLGYIGGQTPHVWTLPEWQRFGHLRQAPIWVYDAGQDPIKAGATAGLRMKGLGWTPNAGRFCVADMEAQRNDPWLTQFALELKAVGYETVKYDSLSAGIELPQGVLAEWVALWDHLSDIPPGCVAHQFLANQNWAGTQVDYSVWEDAFLQRFGWGPRQ